MKLRRRQRPTYTDTSNPDIENHTLFMNLYRVIIAMICLILATQHFFLDEWIIASVFLGGVGLACSTLDG
jgi:hypothetical protein